MLLAHGLELFAQAGNQIGGGGGGNANAAMNGPGMMGVLCFYGVLVAVSILVHCLFLNALSKCFKEIAPRNRTMEPGQVWLNLIPLFGTVWIFITVFRLAESLQQEYRSRRLSGDGDFGKQNGLIFLVLSLIGCGCIGIIFFVMYWVKISGYTKELRETGRGDREDDDFESEDEYRDRRSRDRDDRRDRDDNDDRNEDDDYRPRGR